MKGDAEVVCMVVFFMVGALISKSPVENKEVIFSILGPVATLLAAYFGARFAFSHQGRRDVKLRVDEEVAAFNSALFGLVRIISTFKGYSAQILPHPNFPDQAHLTTPPLIGYTRPKIEFDFKSLGFILQSNDPDILSDVDSLERSATTSINICLERSRVHIEQLQPFINELEKSGKDISPPGVQRAIDPILDQRLRML